MPTPGPADLDDPPRVYLDVMLGSLATILRMAGWDAAYALDRGVEADDEIRRQTEASDRLLLTRDVQLAERTPDSILLTTKAVEDQVAELRAAGYAVEFDTPSRCASCNGRLETVPSTAATPTHAPDPDEERVWRCEAGGQYFWRGSHWDDVVDRLASDGDAGNE